MRKLILMTLTLMSISIAFAGWIAARGAIAAEQPAQTAASNEKKFTLVSEQVGETKFWFPSTIVVEPGDKVKLTLKNEVPGGEATHGFSLPAFNITEVVTRGTDKTVEFTADKPGIYPYFCQLHPKHVGGQVVVESAAK